MSGRMQVLASIIAVTAYGGVRHWRCVIHCCTSVGCVPCSGSCSCGPGCYVGCVPGKRCTGSLCVMRRGARGIYMHNSRQQQLLALSTAGAAEHCGEQLVLLCFCVYVPVDTAQGCVFYVHGTSFHAFCLLLRRFLQRTTWKGMLLAAHNLERHAVGSTLA